MKKNIALVLALIFLLTLAIPASADGIGDSMAELGFAFLRGEGVEQDFQKALEYLAEADRYGNTEVQFSIGEIFEHGIGVETDLVVAVQWYLKAADLGSQAARAKLENDPFKSIARAMNVQYQETTQPYPTYDSGSVQNLDYSQNALEADNGTGERNGALFNDYLNAAEQGDPAAMFTVGEIYENGTGVEENLVEAVKWYIKAAEAGNSDARKKLENEPMKSIAEAMSVQAQATHVPTATGDMEYIPRKGPVYPECLVNNPVVDATDITITILINIISGILPDDWYIYVKDANNHWNHVAMFEITEEQKNGQAVVCHLKLDSKQTFTEIALNPVYPGMEFSASFQTYLFASEGNIGEYGPNIPKPAFTLASGKGSMSISRHLEVRGTPTNILGYAGGGGVCFVAGTLVHTKNGLVPIEEIRKGDLVWSWNDRTNQVELKPILETYVNPSDELIHLCANGEIITCTSQHRFYVQEKGWIRAGDLCVGDQLALLDGTTAVLESVQREKLENAVKVYNFQVKDTHSYYIGELGVRAHNATSDSPCA